MNELPKRKQIRLKNYDYSQNGFYFITICTHNKQRLFEFSTVGNDLCVVPSPKPPNNIIEKWLCETENKFGIKIEQYIIMPDHIHMIVNIKPTEIQNAERHIGRSLQDIMQWFKTMTTNEYINAVKNGEIKPFVKKLWQKSYYEHIIRNERDYTETLEYSVNNPLKYKILHE